MTWSVVVSCGNCFYCQNGLPQKCSSLFKYGHETCDGVHPLSGGLAEVCHLAAGTAILKVPTELPDLIAASANCATATAAAAMRASGGCTGAVVLIQGAGLLGLTMAAMCHAAGAARIIVVDVDPRRLQTALKFGATETLELANDLVGLTQIIRQATEGRGVDLAFEMSGAAGAFELGIAQLRAGGQYILVGAVKPIGTVPLEPELVVRRMLTIRGVHNYAPRDLVAAIDFLTRNHDLYPFANLIAKVFPLAQANDAFQYMLDHKPVRVAVVQ